MVLSYGVVLQFSFCFLAELPGDGDSEVVSFLIFGSGGRFESPPGRGQFFLFLII